MAHTLPSQENFKILCDNAPSLTGGQHYVVAMFRRLFADQLTPVLAYRRLVQPDDRLAPSFLLESVIDGDRQGRYSYLAAQPAAEFIARQQQVQYIDHRTPARSRTFQAVDPLAELSKLSGQQKLIASPGLPDVTGGWVGYVGYDTVRYVEGEQLPNPPADDRNLPDLHMQLYKEMIVFDHVQKTLLAITHISLNEYDNLDNAYAAGEKALDTLIACLETPTPRFENQDPSRLGAIDLETPPPKLPTSNMGEGGYQKAVCKIREYIKAGDAFQVVPSQRFELATQVDPFDIYRALRVVNPSPYMFYMQIQGGMLVGSSPEILCKVRDGVVTNRPLAGTRRRGKTVAEDIALEKELLADPKDRAEHIMLVDLGRNDVGRIATPGTIKLEKVLSIERYSHVMHLSSTVTGRLQEGLTCWDALQATLPVGTVSGAPKVRAMQIIDEVESTRRGPYGGAVGMVDLAGNMDMAIALRTMVVLPNKNAGGWKVHLQAGGGIVYDSDPDAEHIETMNKAAALAKSVEVAEQAFGRKT